MGILVVVGMLVVLSVLAMAGLGADSRYDQDAPMNPARVGR
jgi:hypothetical protein